MYRGVTKLWTPPVVYVSRARNNLSFSVCLSLHPCPVHSLLSSLFQITMTTPYPLAVPPLPTLFPRSWSWSRSHCRCLPWLMSSLCHCLPHPPSLIASLSISHQFLLDTSRSNWTNIWDRPLLSNFFQILPLALPWSTSPTLCLTKHQIQIFITLKKGPMQFFLHLSESVIFVQNKYRITNHQTWKYSLLHCLSTAQLISKMKGCFVIFNSSFTEQNY